MTPTGMAMYSSWLTEDKATNSRMFLAAQTNSAVLAAGCPLPYLYTGLDSR